MKNIIPISFLSIYLILLLSHLIYSAPKINTLINLDDITNNQRCYDNKEQMNSGSSDDKISYEDNLILLFFSLGINVLPLSGNENKHIL